MLPWDIAPAIQNISSGNGSQAVVNVGGVDRSKVGGNAELQATAGNINNIASNGGSSQIVVGGVQDGRISGSIKTNVSMGVVNSVSQGRGSRTTNSVGAVGGN